MTVQQVVDALGAAGRWTYRDEEDLHLAVCAELLQAGIRHGHEVHLGPAGRIDLLAEGGVGIEVKVAGSLVDVVRQLTRYAHSDRVGGLVLVTTLARHAAVPAELGGVPVSVFSLLGQAL